jgi:hypothetical protein
MNHVFLFSKHYFLFLKSCAFQDKFQMPKYAILQDGEGVPVNVQGHSQKFKIK